jgi:predicted esterase
LLCTRGKRISNLPGGHGGWYYPDHHFLGREIRAALAALEREFGTEVELSGAVYAGYSQGATMGAHALAGAPEPFARLILVEGGASAWNVAHAGKFARAGGKRVLFACGVGQCANAAERASGWLRKAGIQTEHVHAAGAGHTYLGAVGRLLEARLPWLLDGDSRWSLENDSP